MSMKDNKEFNSCKLDSRGVRIFHFPYIPNTMVCFGVMNFGCWKDESGSLIFYRKI